MDWKSAVLSQANWTTLERRKEELRKLISSRDEGRRVLRSLEEEIGAMQSKINSSDSSESFRKLCREISVRIADTQDRLKGSLSLVDEEMRRVMETLNVVGESGLVDTFSSVKEQEKIFKEVSRLLEATVRNMEFIGTEFRASASSRLGTRGN
jgi:DNA-binding transcriptional ArsR family regulator